MEIYAPIAHRLGMQRAKWELEDLALMYLDPAGYKEITDTLNYRMETLKTFRSNVAAKIKKRLLRGASFVPPLGEPLRLYH